MATQQSNHILYHFYYSICSIMVRYTIALKGQAKDPKHEIQVQEEEVNIQKGEQLTEHYLCDINACGEVPVIARASSKEKIPDSLEITKYLAGSYPSLIPASHAEEILRLLFELHSLNYFSLSFTGKPEGPQGAKVFLEKQLESEISDRYREACKCKITRIETNKLGGLKPDVVKENEEKARALMKEFESLLAGSQTGWIFGLSQPSALDAHLIALIARMLDVSRGELIPGKLKAYVEKAMGGEEWKAVMQGRNTFGPSQSFQK